MSLPKISVLMPVFNAPEDFLQEAIDSILAQSYEDFELLILDDGSTNGLSDFLKKYSDPRIVYHRNDINLGIACTLNRGIELSKGEFIARMDADDISHPERFERQVEFLDTHPEVSLVGTRYRVLGTPVIKSVPLHVTFLELLKECCVAHPTVMWRKGEFERFGLRYNKGYEGAEDYDLWSRAIEFMKMANLPEVLLDYRIHSASVSQAKSSLQRQISKRIQCNMLSALGGDNWMQGQIYSLVNSGAETEKNFYLFGVIPFVTIKAKRHKMRVLLFGVLPIFKITTTYRFKNMLS